MSELDSATPLRAFDMSGRAAIVTGAGSGIGARSAECFAAMGASVMLADLDVDAAQRVAANCGGPGEKVARPLDVSSKGEFDQVVAEAVTHFGRLDVLANVAGIACDALIGDLDEEKLDRALAVNVKGTVFGCQAALEVMKGQRSGSIINVSSAAIDYPTKGNAGYAMTKAAVAMLTRTLAMEAGEFGIRVNAIAPGPTLTNFTKRHLLRDDGTMDEGRLASVLEEFRELSPIGQLGEPEDQALLILYLGSDASRFVTGATLRANGGIGMV
jgi:3-oxoacyl-[acyl-carrier protein] reductase